MEYKDYYSILGVNKDAPPTEIQRAYRRLARQYHPDVNKDPGAEAKFKEIGEAYEVLGDKEKRAKYDQFGAAWKTARQTGTPPPGWEHFQFGFGDEPADLGFGPSGFSSFFEMLFSSPQGPRAGGWGDSWQAGTRRPLRGQDLESRLEVKLEEVRSGGQRRITLTHPETGEQKSYVVKIPRGVRAGQKIRLAGKGGPAPSGGTAGDLYLTIELQPDARFRVDGADLYTTLPVTPWEAALGGKADLETLDGRVTVKIPAGSSSGRKIRLRNRGLPTSSDGTGDLFAEIKVVVPETLSKEERELFEKLAEVSRFQARS